MLLVSSILHRLGRIGYGIISDDEFSCLLLWSLVYVITCQHSGPPIPLSFSSS